MLISELFTVFLQPCLLKMESFFCLQNVPEERLARSMLYQWMQITYQDLVALTLESLGISSFEYLLFITAELFCEKSLFLVLPYHALQLY
jgi:hypothetical protein